MPNTAVKPLYAESTRLETVREDRELPVRKIPHLMDAEFFYASGGWIPDAGASAFEFAALWAAGTGLPGLSPYIVGVIDFNGNHRNGIVDGSVPGTTGSIARHQRGGGVPEARPPRPPIFFIQNP